MTVKEITIPFKPRRWQLELFKKLKRFNVLVVHRGAGKTVFTINYLIMRALQGPARAEYAYILPQKEQADRVAWRPLQYYLGAIPGVKFNNSTHVIELPNKAIIRLLGANDPENLRGMHLHGMVLDEFADMHPNTWLTVEPMTKNHKAFVIWIGTPKGENVFKKMYDHAVDPANSKNWFGARLTVYDTGIYDDEEIEESRRIQTPEDFAQEYECSFAAALKGAFYAKELDELVAQGRVTAVEHVPDLAVHTAWDLGMDDAMAVWFYQLHNGDVKILRYEETRDRSFADWADILSQLAKKHGYRYGAHWAPHDIAVREFSSGMTRKAVAAKLGIHFRALPQQKVNDAIAATKLFIPRCMFDAHGCEHGLMHLRNYKSAPNKSGLWLPVHDEHSHAADAFRYLVAGVNMGNIKPTKMKIIGF